MADGKRKVTGGIVKIAYFDCFSGISGDMCLGAVVDAGVPIGSLERELKKLGIRGYALIKRRVRRAGITATKVDVVMQSSGAVQGRQEQTWPDIERIIDRSGFGPEIRQQGKTVFKTIFQAEARVHGKTLKSVHLHELGAVDCLVDVFGTLAGLALLGVERIYCSAVNVGSGSIRTEHGMLPVPAPATAEILRGARVFSSDIPFELATPTGASIVKAMSEGFGPLPVCVVERIGVGAGSRDIAGMPNVLRILIGETGRESAPERVTVIETNIDDMNPQVYEHLMDTLFREGALDVYLTQVIMKKTRPAVKLTILCDADKRGALTKIVFRETTTIGLRYYEADRVTLKREIRPVKTAYGTVRMKYSGLGSLVSKSSPEYEDCRRIAVKKGIPLHSVMEEIRREVRKRK